MTSKAIKELVKIDDVEFQASDLTFTASKKDFRDAWTLGAGSVVKVDWQKARENFRADAALPKVSFIMAAVRLGFLASEDAVRAARGEWPASFDEALSAMPEEERLGAQVTWASITEVRRNAPLLMRIGAVKGISAEQFDAMFGYAGE
jgi:hypothetical protein